MSTSVTINSNFTIREEHRQVIICQDGQDKIIISTCWEEFRYPELLVKIGGHCYSRTASQVLEYFEKYGLTVPDSLSVLRWYATIEKTGLAEEEQTFSIFN